MELGAVVVNSQVKGVCRKLDLLETVELCGRIKLFIEFNKIVAWVGWTKKCLA